MKIISDKKKTIVTKTEIKTYKTDTEIFFRETWINGEHKGITADITPKKGDKNEYQSVFMKKNAFSKNAMKEYKGFFEWIEEYRETNISSIEDIKKYNVCISYSGGWIIFDEKRKPISIPYIFDYIGSLREKMPNDPIYKKLISLLKKHPSVLELEEKEIEYYNQDFSSQKGIGSCKVLLPQEMYEKVYVACKKDEYWSVKMHDMMKLCPWANKYGLEIYGPEIAALAKKWEKQTEYKDEENDDRNT